MSQAHAEVACLLREGMWQWDVTLGNEMAMRCDSPLMWKRHTRNTNWDVTLLCQTLPIRMSRVTSHCRIPSLSRHAIAGNEMAMRCDSHLTSHISCEDTPSHCMAMWRLLAMRWQWDGNEMWQWGDEMGVRCDSHLIANEAMTHILLPMRPWLTSDVAIRWQWDCKWDVTLEMWMAMRCGKEMRQCEDTPAHCRCGKWDVTLGNEMAMRWQWDVTHISLPMRQRCPKLQIIFHKRATKSSHCNVKTRHLIADVAMRCDSFMSAVTHSYESCRAYKWVLAKPHKEY